MTVLAGQLLNPPITEAIILLSFKTELEISVLESFVNSEFCKNGNCKIDQIHKVEIKTGAAVENRFQSSRNHDGFSIKFDDENKNVLRIQRTHLSFHFFNKYVKWDNMLSEFQSIWKEFSSMIQVLEINRVALRYINQISVPNELPNGIQDVVNLLPLVPADVSDTLEGFFMQLNIPGNAENLKGVVTETILPADSSRPLPSILLDINVIQSENLNNEVALFNAFNALRKFKNQIFFGCITERTLKSFNQKV